MKQILLLVSLFISSVMIAGEVTEQEALKKAQQFAANKMSSKMNRSMQVEKKSIQHAFNRAGAQREYLHIFNIEGGGYIIVSADDRTEEILGYSTTGTFDANQIPENMRAFLQEYVNGIQYLDNHHIQVAKSTESKRTSRRAVKASIAPLLSTTWDQWPPYSSSCPSSEGKQTFTGCVATAMAQVMGYHKWPNATTKEIPAYTSTNGSLSFDLSAIPAGTAIEWDKMKNSYDMDGTQTKTAAECTDSEKAVASLMQLCGQSVQMNYGLGSSNATTGMALWALIKYFDYDASAHWAFRKNYTYDEWQDLIYAELANNRPVLYDGQSAGGGHAFVCDGYDKDDFFHINWGWGGQSDNYFRLRLLNPDNQGTGGSNTNEGYGVEQSAGIGIKKNAGTVDTYNGLYVTQLTSKENSVTRASATTNFNFTVYFNFYNLGFLDKQYTAFRILNSSNAVVKTINLTQLELGPKQYYVS